MSSDDLDRIVEQYLERLDAALADVPPARRHRLIADLAEHVEEARAGLPQQTEVALRALLDRVGQPEDIAASALADPDDRVGRPFPIADRPETPRPDRRLVGGLVGLAVLLAIGIVLAVTLSGGTTAPSVRQASATTTTGTHTGAVVTVVPNVVGQLASVATSELQEADLTTGTVVGQEPAADVPPGSVLSQRPAAGTSLRPGSTVTLTVATSLATTTSVPAIPSTTAPSGLGRLAQL